LPRKDKWAKQLIATGVNDLRTIDLNSFSNEVYQRIGRSLQAGQFQLEANAKKIVSQLPYPYYFMDFETVNPAIPVWAGTRPYQQVPFQWSCHIQAENGVMRHEAYLSDAHSDPRLAFTESLVALLGNTTGTIFVYHAPFEKSHLREMAQVFPQYHDQIQGMNARIFDLLPLMRNHYYHPNMRGSWSIKAVLPTIADDLDYQQLMVSHGGDAMEAFNEMMQLSTSSERYHALKQGLLDYCKLDTLAMVRLVDFVMNKG
jgi:hypothetical protein